MFSNIYILYNISNIIARSNFIADYIQKLGGKKCRELFPQNFRTFLVNIFGGFLSLKYFFNKILLDKHIKYLFKKINNVYNR